MSLRSRITLLVVVAVTVLLAAGGGLFLHQLESGLNASLDASLTARADGLAQRVGPDGTIGFQDTGKGGLLPPTQALAQVVGAAGSLLDSSQGTQGQPLLTAAQLTHARKQPVTVNSTLVRGASVRLLAVPVAGSGKPPMVVVVGTSREIPLQAVARVRKGLIVAACAGVLLSGMGAWLLAGVALRPVERMRRQAAEISAGDLTARLRVPRSRDEIARLGDTMNSLLERLQQALSRQRNFVADAGHELRTPLTILRAELELGSRPGRARQDLPDVFRRAAEETDRLIRLTEDLLLLAQEDNPDTLLMRRPVQLSSVIQESVAAAAASAGTADVRVVFAPAAPILVAGDPDRLRQVVDNLLDNAIRFAPTHSTVTVRVASAGDGRSAVFEVLDEGPGFPTDFLPHAFERFRRADESRNAADGGTGLGLAIVASLVAAHGGTVTAQNRLIGGGCVQVQLPLALPTPNSSTTAGTTPAC